MFVLYFKIFDVSGGFMGQGCKNPECDHLWKIIGGNTLYV